MFVRCTTTAALPDFMRRLDGGPAARNGRRLVAADFRCPRRSTGGLMSTVCVNRRTTRGPNADRRPRRLDGVKTDRLPMSRRRSQRDLVDPAAVGRRRMQYTHHSQRRKLSTRASPVASHALTAGRRLGRDSIFNQDKRYDNSHG